MRNRFPAFILAVATTLFVSVGAFAYDSHLAQTLDGYGDFPIMTIADAPFSLSLLDSSYSLTFSGFPAPLSSYNRTVSSFYGYSAGGPYAYADLYMPSDISSFTSRVSGTVNYFTVGLSTPISVSSPSEIRITGNLSVILRFFLSMYLHGYYSSSSTSYIVEWQTSGQTTIVPSSIDVLVNGDVFTTLFPSSTSLDVDVVIPASSSVLISFRINYNRSVAASATFTRSSRGYSLAGHNINLFVDNPTTAYNSGKQSFGGFTFNTSALTYEVVDLPTDYTGILYQILNVLNSIGSSVSQLSPMEQFENNYLDNFGGQISQAESAISPSNPALPNGGDIGGFMSDVSDGLGLSGSSFSASDLNDAAAGFSGADATAVGGPWEFFTQVVADDMSGDSPMGIDSEYDPILAWLERAEGRYGVWSNP